MLKEELEGDYLLQFALINYINPDTILPKLQAREKKLLKIKTIKNEICLNITELYVMMVYQALNSNKRMAKNLSILCEWRKDINLLEFLKQIHH